jgi:hypothetical protein
MFNVCFSQQNKEIYEIYLLNNHSLINSYVEFFSTDIEDYFNPEKSSKYPSVNLFDGNIASCWVAGKLKQENKSELYVKIPQEIFYNKLIFNIFSGYGKSRSLFLKNARPLKIHLSIFASQQPQGYSTEVANLYLLNKTVIVDTVIMLADTFGVQLFKLKLDNKKIERCLQETLKKCKCFNGKDFKVQDNLDIKFAPSLIMKLIIQDVYQGTQYDDICISEIFFNNRFVSSCSAVYKQINNVYIKNDNIFMVEYADKREEELFRDESAVFTMTDWEKNINFAILHYVHNDAVNESSRIEEQYMLIDLKSGKDITKEIEKYSGIYLNNFTIYKNKSGKVYLDNFGKFKIELK